ncbi:MAG: O-antigen ligase family protein [Phycisphaeraceae bacterium]
MARKLIISLLVLLLVLLPHHNGVLWLFGEGPIRYWKEAAFLLMVVVYLLFVALPRGWPQQVRAGVLLVLPLVLVVVWRAGLGVIQGEDLKLVVVGAANMLVFVPAFLVVAQLLTRPEHVERAIRVMLVLTTIAGLLSIADWAFALSARFDYFGRVRVQEASHYSDTALRSCLTFSSPMVLGMFTGLGVMIAAWRVSDLREPLVRRIPAMICLLICLAGMLFTFSRGPWVSCALGTGLIVALRNHGISLRDLARRHLSIGYLMLLGLCLIALGVLVMPAGWQEHVLSIFDWANDPNNSVRIRRMHMGLDMIGDRPFLGHGLGTMQPRLLEYRIEELGYDYFFTNPESQILLLLVEGGMLLLGSFLFVLIGFAAWTLWLARAQNPPRIRGMGVLLLGILAALTVESAIMPMLDTRLFKLIFWCLFGATLALGRCLEQQPRASEAQPAQPATDPPTEPAGAPAADGA